MFFDEIDALCPRRSESNSTRVSERVVSQLLAEIDGVEELPDVLVLAATNRIDMIEPALMSAGEIRPGGRDSNPVKTGNSRYPENPHTEKASRNGREAESARGAA